MKIYTKTKRSGLNDTSYEEFLVDSIEFNNYHSKYLLIILMIILIALCIM